MFESAGKLIVAGIIGLAGALYIPLTSAWAADSQPSPIALPGSVKAAKSPSGRYEVTIKRLANQDGSPTYRLILHDLQQHLQQQILTFQRSVELTWRSGAEGFFLNEYTASNFSDCLVAIPGKGMEFHSLLDRLSKQPELGVPETVDSAHFYVECRGWNGANQVAVALFGHKDEDGKEFSYGLKYDAIGDILQK